MAKLPRPKVDTNGFRSRSPEVSRIEGFSDAVFGFAVTLLVVALEVPRTFDQLVASLRGFAAFGFCFAMLFYVWNLHYLYCRRFGLEDAVSRTLTGLLLFVVLLYVYPLKFLATLFVGGVLGLDRGVAGRYSIRMDQVPQLFEIYGIGFVLMFGLLSLMYGYAYRRREALEMDEVERFATQREMGMMRLMAGVGLLSIVLAMVLPLRWAGLAGFTYTAMGPLGGWYGGATGRKLRAMQALR